MYYHLDVKSYPKYITAIVQQQSYAKVQSYMDCQFVDSPSQYMDPASVRN